MLQRSAPLLAAIALASGATAQELRPVKAHGVTLGPVAGIAYYTEQLEGYRVVATLASEGAAAPLRVIATLLPGQAMTLSVPREAGIPPVELVLARRGDRVVLLDNAPATH